MLCSSSTEEACKLIHEYIKLKYYIESIFQDQVEVPEVMVHQDNEEIGVSRDCQDQQDHKDPQVEARKTIFLQLCMPKQTHRMYLYHYSLHTYAMFNP